LREVLRRRAHCRRRQGLEGKSTSPRLRPACSGPYSGAQRPSRATKPAANMRNFTARTPARRTPTVFETTIAGSLPKPGWLAETNKLWPAWRAAGEELERAKRDATLLWLKEQEAAGIDIVTDGEQSRQHFVHGFLEYVEGIDFEHKVT